MNATTAPSPSPRWIAPVFLGGLLSGAIDLIYACTYHGLVNKIPPARIFQSIGSGWFGKASFDMGWESATIGFLSHFGILIVAAGIFYAARTRFTLLRERPYLCGMGFGVGIWLTMNYIVLPLSAAPHFQSKPLTTATDFAVHVLLLGPAISMVAKRFDRSAMR